MSAMKTKIIWDHTSIGSPVIFHPCLSSPLTVLLKEQTVGLGCRHMASVGCERGTFIATLGVNKNGENLIASVDKFDERIDFQSGGFLLLGDIAVPTVFHQRTICLDERTSADYACNLKSLHRSVSSSSEVSLSRCINLRLHIHLVGPNCKVEVQGLTPTNSFRAIPVPPLPLLTTALTESMSRNPANSPKTGFLTMDASKKLILLLENDPRIRTCPLIGIWVSGVPTLVDPFVWASCLRFFSCPDYSKRVVRPEEPFLLVVYSTLHLGPEFYDCLCNASKISYRLLEGHCQLTVTKVPSFSSKVSAVELHPVENQKHLKIFHIAEDAFQQDIVSLPYCDSAVLAFPSDSCDYPRSSPDPPSQNFILKPSVPDLSLLSEVGQLSVKNICWPDQRPPLKPVNHVWNPHLQRKREPSCPVTNQRRASSPSLKENPIPKDSSLEPLPLPAVHKDLKKITFGDLKSEVEQILHTGITVTDCLYQKVQNGRSSGRNHGCETKTNIADPDTNRLYGNTHRETRSASSGNDTSQSPVEHIQKISTSSAVTYPKTRQGDPLEEEDLCDRTAIFQNLQQLLKQKDSQMHELQEQVNELLVLQRQQVSRPASQDAHLQRSEDSYKLMHKIDEQNLQLNQLKEQISLLLDSQITQAKLTKDVTSQMEKCSVGVMTSILVDPQELRSPVLSCHSASTKVPCQSAMRPCNSQPVCDSPFVDNNWTPALQFQTDKNAGLPGRRLGKCCACQCQQLDSVSVEKPRFEPVPDETLSSAPSLHLELDQLQPPLGLSVDGSLPLGASVSLLEDRFHKFPLPRAHRFHRSQSSSDEDSDVQEFPDAISEYAPEIESRHQRQFDRMSRKSRLSLPNKQVHEEQWLVGPRRSSLDNNSSLPRNVMHGHKWDGSVLLPKLNYQTLCFSDDSDSESVREADRLSEKYLKSAKSRMEVPSRALERRITATPSSDVHAKNMSFASREYLERYGLAS